MLVDALADDVVFGEFVGRRGVCAFRGFVHEGGELLPGLLHIGAVVVVGGLAELGPVEGLMYERLQYGTHADALGVLLELDDGEPDGPSAEILVEAFVGASATKGLEKLDELLVGEFDLGAQDA